MSAIDTVIALRILKLLTDPFDQWEACHLGIIDSVGKLLITDSTKFTDEQRSAWTMLQRLVWRLKLLIGKIPGGQSRFASFAAAYLLVKESIEYDREPKNISECLIAKLQHVTSKEIKLVEDMVSAGPTTVVGSDVHTHTLDNPKPLKKKMVTRFKDFRNEKLNGN